MSRASEVSLIGLGAALTVLGGALLWRAHDVQQTRYATGVLACGLLILPSVASVLAGAIKQVGGALAEAWKAKGETKP